MEMQAQWDLGGGRILLGDNRRWEGHAEADQVPVRWSSVILSEEDKLTVFEKQEDTGLWV